jgi:hypothetical protein
MAAAVGGGVLAMGLAVVTRLDVQLVAAFRGSRTMPYRIAFFILLCAACAVAMRLHGRDGRVQSRWRAVLVGAVVGYLAGLAAAQFVAFVLISHAGARRILTSGVDGLLIVFAVPGITFSWLFGIVAYVLATLILGTPWRMRST